MRLTCPSCSTQLIVKDEFAGRAVKCPKCATIIPPTAPPAAVSPPPPPPPPPRVAPVAEPTSKPKLKTARPQSVGDALDAGIKPKAKATARKVVAEEDDEDERPTRSRRRPRDDENDEDEDRPRRRRLSDSSDSSGKMSNATAMLIIFGVLFVICSGLGVGVYAGVRKLADTVQKKAEEHKKEREQEHKIRQEEQKAREATGITRRPLSRATYDQITFTMTRADVEAMFGEGDLVDEEDVADIFDNTEVNAAGWLPKAASGRVRLWVNDDADLMLIAFHPNGGIDARVQLKAYVPPEGRAVSAGTADDNQYARENPPGKPKTTSQANTVQIVDLTREYNANAATADQKYKGKVIRVEGAILEKLEGTTALVTPRPGQPYAQIRVTFPASLQQQLRAIRPGSPIRFEGRCEGRGANGVLTVQEASLVP